MRANAILFWILAIFFLLSAIVYTLWSLLDPMHMKVEWVGTVALTLSAILAAFIAFYVGRSHASQGGELPEDKLDANIDDGDPELGHFSPWSWWPGRRLLDLLHRCGLRAGLHRRLGLRVLPGLLRPLSHALPGYASTS